MTKSFKAFITGIAGKVLSAQEKEFIAAHQPWGFILFARNIESANQLCRLTDSLREVTKRDDLPILIDQEGGRVRRLRPPLVQEYPAAATIGQLYQQNPKTGLRAAWLMSRLQAFDLRRFGLNVNCAPVLDVLIKGAHEAIGSRSFGSAAQIVTALGQAAAEGLAAGGVLPIIKHIPGQGRALQDTHFGLATIDTPLEILRQSDFIPFKTLNHLPLAMNSHVIYNSIDATQPATFSSKLVKEIIREEIGFNGLLMSDDLGMHALSGPFNERAQKCLKAGFDLVLHCSGDMAEMQKISAVAPLLADESLKRAQAAFTYLQSVDKGDESILRQEFAALMETCLDKQS